MILIKPVRENTGGEFAEQILTDLIAQGYSGEVLLKKFKERQKKVRPAVEKIIEKAKEAAKGNGDFYTYDDVFGSGISMAITIILPPAARLLKKIKR